MGLDVSVAIGTFGAQAWIRFAQRAIASVPDGIPVHHAHGATLAAARNEALERVETEFVIHLDADDELAPGYIEAMAAGSADLRGPSLQRTRGHRDWGEPYMPTVYAHDHACVADCLRLGNWLLIGTCLRTALAREVGGWEEWTWSEDYALFARCWVAGGTVEAIPEAIYRGEYRVDSRNRAGRATSLQVHRAIEAAIWPNEESRI